MKLYLVQHGEAVAETEDPMRPLTDQGRADVAELARFLAASGVGVSRIVHSDKRRAADTAMMLKDALGNPPLEVMAKGLLPKDSPEPLVDVVGAWQEDTLVVGHQPLLGRLVSRLVLGAEQPTLVGVVPGTIVCLSRRGATGAWFIAWMMPPELLRR